MTFHLYQIAEDLRAILDEYESGAITDDMLADLIGDVDSAFDDKARAVAAYVQEQEAICTAIQTAIAKLCERNDKIIKRCNWLTDYLKAQMKAVDKRKIETPEFTIAIQENPPKVRLLVPANEVPANFMTKPKPPEPKPNLPAIRQHLKELGDLERCGWAKLEQDERLTIKS